MPLRRGEWKQNLHYCKRLHSRQAIFRRAIAGRKNYGYQGKNAISPSPSDIWISFTCYYLVFLKHSKAVSVAGSEQFKRPRSCLGKEPSVAKGEGDVVY
jgi:hypothetical protein